MKIEPFFNQVLDWGNLLLRGRQRQRPGWLVIESTSRCTASCPVCGTTNARRLGRGDMDFSSFPELARQAALLAPRKVGLHGRGEPLLHPNISDMVAILKSNGLKTQLVTNGDLLTAEVARSLQTAGLDELVVSMPSITPENFRAVRGRNIKPDEEHRLASALSAWEKGVPGRVVVRALVLPQLLGRGDAELAEYVLKWQRTGAIDKLEFTLYQPWPRHVLEEYLQFIYRRSSLCRICLDNLSVFWDGSIGPCSYDVDGELVYGAWPKMTLLDAFNARGIRKIRRSMLIRQRKRPVLCRACLLTRVPTVTAVVSCRKGTAGQDRTSWAKNKASMVWKRLTANRVAQSKK